MQRPAEMEWYQPRCIGDVPKRRNGHTFSLTKGIGYIFGGCDNRKPPGPNNELFKVDMSNMKEFYFSEVKAQGGKCPEPRWKHSAVNIEEDGSQIIVFGGFKSSMARYNDVWILDTTSDRWTSPKMNMDNAPCPRGAHGACIVGDKMYIFGGYGGNGYSRKDFNDMYTLNVKTWEWEVVKYYEDDEEELEIPAPRSGLQLTAVGEQLYMCGGWSASEQYDDMWQFDTTTLKWTKLENASGPENWGPPRWNHSAISVFAVPYYKIFVFGGNSGDLTDSGTDPLGNYANDLVVYEIGQGSWSRPTTIGSLPCARSDSEMVYDRHNGNMIIFGGWANKWLGDANVCKVKDVVGPPYSIDTISPVAGPFTGGQKAIIKGMGFSFSNATTAKIRFACPKSATPIVADGVIKDSNTIELETPNYEKMGATISEVRVDIAKKGLTNSTTSYNFFSVANATTSLAFGPGVLNGFEAHSETSFVIQARDSAGLNRVCGMDEFEINIKQIVPPGVKGPDDPSELVVPYKLVDQGDGTYMVTYTAPKVTTYSIDVIFLGTFAGVKGHIRGSPFTVSAVESAAVKNVNDIAGGLLVQHIKEATSELKDYCNKSLSGFKTTIPQDQVEPLIKVKEHLKRVKERTPELELRIDSMKASLEYAKKKGYKVDRIDSMMNNIDNAASLWKDTLVQAPKTSNSIISNNKIWTQKMSDKIDEYEAEMQKKLKDFRKLPFWSYSVGPETGRAEIKTQAESKQVIEKQKLKEHEHLCSIFEFPEKIETSKEIISTMDHELEQMIKVWDVCEALQCFITESKDVLWSEVSPDALDEEIKVHMKAVKGLHKDTRWSDAYKGTDKMCKDFMNTIPLIAALGAKSMRPRHWSMLMKATEITFTPPYEDPDLKLGGLLSLNLHEFTNEVEEICDQANKEEKIEMALVKLNDVWSGIEWLCDYYKETDTPLLKIGEEDFEALENDQLAIQGMMANRYVAQFYDEVSSWQKQLGTVNEIFLVFQEIQRTWSYLEPLFIGSEEVKKELPEDAILFAKIDVNVKKELKDAWAIKNINKSCNVEGLLERLEEIQKQLDICKKSLADFLDGRRRQFPRYYFTSESDLLDILSNGSTPSKILVHTPKIYLSTKTLVLGDEVTSTGRPKAIRFIADVGVEEVDFEPAVPLEGKVEIYMQTVLDAIKQTLFNNLKRSIARYGNDPNRENWLMEKQKKTGRPLDPAQIILLVVAIYYVQQVEEAFSNLSTNPRAMKDQHEKTMDQLADLIKLTQSNITKGDRQRVMVCITMDAHSRDIVDKLCREKCDDVSCFQWQSQLKHKWRIPPSHASFVERDTHLRGNGGERAEVAICDAVLPYDYEYLGNGPRLVITPLTDRIYVTATQALNLKMGCAPAGPAGTGKTETTKDLASALAKCCYVFNCSPEMDYLGLGNIFKGLASSGAWGCFDEFNRLVPEVLSVCSVQFKSVCDGCKANAPRVVIEGDEVKLDPTCGAYITMNPGYLGRSELPEGLKALFRPMTVMVPDLVLICENMLMAEGFVTAKVLASKFYGLYSLLRELLSKQMHYDWGLRAVKSVLVVAGSFKRAEPDLEESELLMRALRDFNIPKIVSEDLVVFYGLLGDLFPNINPPRKQDPVLEEAVEQACVNLKNHPDEYFRLKVVQLEELLAIRHCVFVMGPSACGKSQCWKTLAEARKIINPKAPTKVVDLNPKAVKTEELYGFISMATREWKDGLLSSIMRDLGLIPNENPKWILLDGDLDANWIESMNSVMDDNRMLTLASNERIPLRPYMRMIFEIRDLAFASPATVSRAGILYISADEGTQWRCLIQSWLNNNKIENNEDGFQPEAIEVLAQCFETYCAPTLRYMKINIKQLIPLTEVNVIQNLLFMLDGNLNASNTVEPTVIETIFVYCAVWAFGCTLTLADDGTDYKKMLSDFWRSEFKKVKIPSRETVFDYWLDPETYQFDQWTKSPYFYQIEYDSKTTPMTQVTVPTPETCSVSFWMQTLVDMKRPVMMAGPAGTGKTQLVFGMLGKQNPEKCVSTTINFNFYTTSSVLFNTMALPLEKKVGTTFGPPGNARLVYFVDDLNLPEVDPYNTQSAIALLRQQMEYGHTYDLSKMTQKNIINTQVVACMNPTAGSFMVNPRLQRWFCTFAIGLPGPTSLLTIYTTFLEGHLQYFDEEVRAQCSNVIKAAYGLHQQVASNFRKTAANFHYEFNIRHLSNVFQGLLVSQPEQFKSGEKFVQLWLHESERVYGDRLVSLEDLSKYNQLAQSQAKKLFGSFNMSKFYANENAVPLVFCHFAENIQDKLYDQISSIDKMSSILEDALREYNEVNATMDLVLFEDAMKHVARISRIILNEGGHALLVGVGGMGKQSLARLASFICSYVVKQIVISSTYGINDLKEDLKWMYNKAGMKEEGVTFLLTDSQITNERFLIFINDLLASGNIPDLFTPEEVDTIVNGVTNRVKALGQIPDKKNCWAYFISKIRENLHCCLAFSPVGEDFRSRARKFPALVNCTVIDWFQPWPKDALFSVGKKFLTGLDLGSDGIRASIERFLPYSFEMVNKVAVGFKNKERRHVYTTPKSFLELLKLYRVLLVAKRMESDVAIDRLDNGLQKLKETAESVAEIEENLKISLEQAEEKKTIAEGIAENVSKEKAIVEVETAKAAVEAAEVAKIQAEVQEKQQSTEADLAKAEPAVHAAMAALDTLNKKDLDSCKTMAKPPPGLDDVFASTMCLLAGIHPNIVVTKAGKVKDVSWDTAKKALLLNTGEYIDILKSVKDMADQNTVPLINWKEIRPYLALSHFTPEIIAKKNSAAAGLVTFIINIVNYYDIVITVEPKRKALKEANEMLAAANARLDAVNTTVRELEEKLAKLNEEFAAANKDKQDALDSVARGEKKLNLAQRLTNALAAENERWGINVEEFRRLKELLTGDVLLASAFISYVGPFTKPFRTELMDKNFAPYLMKEFRQVVGEDGVPPISEGADPVSILTNDALVAEWNTDGLPADQVSTENGCIVCNSARWPLMIDPQLQGINWIRNKESGPERNLQVVRLGQTRLIMQLTAALENGQSILIENIGESIDAVLNPVIQRAAIKRGKKQYLKIGDAEVELHPNFRLFLHTKLSNPHYPPEIQAETTLVNFTVTEKGLEDQILALVVGKEREDLAKLGEELLKQQNGFKIKMKELEDNILFKLATAEGDITEDVILIEGLEEAKRVANEINAKAELARETQANIKFTSEKYRPVANRSSLLFFLMNELVKIHTYYIYSLAAFTQVFYRGIDLVPMEVKEREDAEEGEESKVPEMTDEEMASRVKVLIESITKTVFLFIRRGLFERDKLTVSSLLTLRIAVNDGLLTQEEVDYLVLGKSVLDPGNMGPLGEWMPDITWNKVKALEGLKRFQGLGDNMQSDSDDWLKWFDNEQPENAKLPGDYEKQLNDFERLALLRALRPDRVTTALSRYVGKMMGQEYVLQQPFDMPATYVETSPTTPVFFVLFPGVDPTPWVENLGATMGISAETGKFKNISMGQGQEKPAEAVVRKFAEEGGWVMLQNCHLMQTWVPQLERLLEVVGENAHKDFRCFISAEPPAMQGMKNMPESLMQSCIKVANEAPADIKSNMLRSWSAFPESRISECSKQLEFKACAFALCWFHSIVLGRKRFGQQGWSRGYSFNVGDLNICGNVLRAYLDANPTTPWDDLRYIFGEIMYGGHITDAWDRRTCNTYLSVILEHGILGEGGKNPEKEFCPGFKAPNPIKDYNGMIDYINNSLPAESPPHFGLHPNAEIGYLTNSSISLFTTIVNISGSSGGSGGGGAGSAVKEIMKTLDEKLPPEYVMPIINERAKPLIDGESGPFVVVAVQECTRMNALLFEMKLSLSELDKGLKGQLNMSQKMEDLSSALSINEWPGRNPFSLCRWEKLAWPSKKNLMSQFLDMLKRIDQLNSWTDDLVTPVCLWLPGLFNPTAYLTAVMQVTARASGLPLDKMTTETHITTMRDPTIPSSYPDDGAFVHGLFIEGARWPVGEEIAETETIGTTEVGGTLVDSKLKDLLPELPVIYVKAVQVQPDWEPSAVGYLRHKPDIYECPVYLTSMRGPTYIFLATMKSADPVSKWVLTGTAMLMQTDE